MQTSLSREFQNTANGRQAEKILRACVHCGFCNATCPTYELLGDERDGPRGRIYQMKQLFEGHAVSNEMRLHLDRCLVCRACETTCPSAVQYSTLLELSKAALEEKIPRPRVDRIRRQLLGRFIANGTLFARLLRLGWRCATILPRAWRSLLPPPPTRMSAQTAWPPPRHARTMLTLAGCVQPVLTPNTNLAAALVLDRLGISLFEVGTAGCCGSVQLHTVESRGGEIADAIKGTTIGKNNLASSKNSTNSKDSVNGKAAARALIDQWLPHVQRGVEAIVMTASGCGVTIKEYPRLFTDDPEYREKALQISEKTIDLSELVARELANAEVPNATPTNHKITATTLPHNVPRKVAFHAPCTLQHGQQTRGVVESILTRVGYTVCEVRDAHLCCGAAGTYFILQPSIANRLRHNKQAALAETHAEVICTANVGCQAHLSMHSKQPVLHWIELLEKVLPSA